MDPLHSPQRPSRRQATSRDYRARRPASPPRLPHWMPSGSIGPIADPVLPASAYVRAANTAEGLAPIRSLREVALAVPASWSNPRTRLRKRQRLRIAADRQKGGLRALSSPFLRRRYGPGHMGQARFTPPSPTALYPRRGCCARHPYRR
jgi:hypothetical protein